jgi:hypothetical protein
MKRQDGGRTTWMVGSVKFREGAGEGESSQWPWGNGKITSIGVHDDGGDLEIDPVVFHVVSIVLVEPCD